MISLFFTIAGILIILGAMLGVLRAAQHRYQLHPEFSRKAAHIITGLICLSFPWIFTQLWPVLVLTLAITAVLLSLRLVPHLKNQLGGVLGGVERDSLGEIYFPIAVAATFWLAQGNWILYFIPVLVLTVADSVGALVGLRYGIFRFQTDEGEKSAEGSIAFFSAAFLSAHVPLLLFTSIGRAECLLIGLTIGFLIMLLEAISWRGLDNLFIPIGTLYLLKLYWSMDALHLGLRLAVLTCLAILSLYWRKRTTLSDSALMAAALAGYGLWAFGGWSFLVGPLLLFALYLLLPGFDPVTRPIQNLHAVTRVIGGAYLYLFVALNTGNDIGWRPFHLCVACHAGNIIGARLLVLRPNFSKTRVIFIAWLVPILLFAPALLCFIPIRSWAISIALLALAVLTSVLAFTKYWSPITPPPDRQLRQWYVESAIAPLAASIGLFILFTR